MTDKARARLLMNEYLKSVGKIALQEDDEFLRGLANMSHDDFKKISFPASKLFEACYYMGCTKREYIETTIAGIPLELFSDFCHSFVFCFTDCSKDEIEQGYNTFRNYTLVQKREIKSQELCRDLPPNVGVEEDFYVVWTIYQRDEDANADIGPKYFSVIAMNGDVLGNFGVIFHHNRHKPLCVTLPVGGIEWSIETFRHCNHMPPTREVVRHQFIPQTLHFLDLFFSHISKPEFLLELQPFESMGDDFGIDRLYKNLMSRFPENVLRFPASLCRNDSKGDYILYRSTEKCC